MLALASVLDPDLFTHFEITPHRTVLFYLTIFGSVLAVARGMIPEDNQIFDPELLMEEVIHYTHYMPDEWKGQLHSQKVWESHQNCADYSLIHLDSITGSQGLWDAFRYESHDFRPRATVRNYHAIRPLFLAAEVLSCDH